MPSNIIYKVQDYPVKLITDIHPDYLFFESEEDDAYYHFQSILEVSRTIQNLLYKDITNIVIKEE